MRTLFALAILLSSCSPAEYDAYWVRGECQESHSETTFSNECGMAIDGTYDCNPRLRNHRVCDQWGEPVCHPGSDGVADCQ